MDSSLIAIRHSSRSISEYQASSSRCRSRISLDQHASNTSVFTIGVALLTRPQFPFLDLQFFELGARNMRRPVVTTQDQQEAYDRQIHIAAATTHASSASHGIVVALERGLPGLVGGEARAGPDEPEELLHRGLVPCRRAGQQAVGDVRVAVDFDPAAGLHDVVVVVVERREGIAALGLRAKGGVVVLEVAAGGREAADASGAGILVFFSFFQG